jgi:hypothetical protein
MDVENGNRLTFNDVIPLSQGNADLIRQKYVATPEDEAAATANGQRTLKYSLPSDAPYMAAVERGEMDQAQQMVDEKARETGYSDKAYHGTDRFGFTEFNTDNIFVSYGQELAGTYAANSEVRASSGANDKISRALQAMREEGGDVTDLKFNPETGMYEYTEYTAYGPYTGELTEQDIDNYAGRDQSGVYQLYTRPGRQLVIDGNGADWNGIEAPMVSDQPVSTNDIADWAKDNGYDSVRINDIYDSGENSTGREHGDVGIFFNPNAVKSADPVTYDSQGNPIPLSERFNQESNDIRYSLPSDMVLDQQIRQYLAGGGRLQQNATPEAAAPRGEGTPPGAKPQRQWGSQRAENSPMLHEQTINYLKNNSEYDPDSNRAQVNRAFDWIQSLADENDPTGYQAAIAEAESDTFNSSSADGQARMLVLMSMAAVKAEAGDKAAQNDERRLAAAYDKQGTDLGQAFQARQIFRMMTPTGRKAILNKEVNKINDNYKKQGKKTRVKLSPETLEEAGKAKTPKDFDKVRRKAAKELAAQMPANWKDRLVALRMLSMLGNTRTHIRNVLGNAIFMPAVGVKNKVGAAIEIASRQKTRTKTLGFANKESREFAKADAKEMEGILRGDAKYREGSMVEQERKVFGQGKGIVSKTLGKLAQGLIDANGNLLEAEDWIFLNRHYRNALAGYMTANKLTVKDMTGSTLKAARSYAVQEAQKATYRDANRVIEGLNKWEASHPGVKFVGNAILPFKKTPANILKRGVEYSPVGLINALTRGAKQVKLWNDYQNHKLEAPPDKAISPTQWIDKISAGLTGTSIMVLGALLSSMGAATAGLDDDDDEFAKLRGEQEYAINPGKIGNTVLQALGVPKLFGEDVSYTVDWAAPVSLPFFVGAAIWDTYKDRGELSISSMLNELMGITEPMFNLSMLDGVNSLLDVNQYAEGNAITQIGTKILTNYATSYVPSALGAYTRSKDPVRRKAFVESGADLSTARYAWEQTENKLPWLSTSNIPYRDVWGNAEISSQGEAVIENFLSPGYANQIKDDPVVNELERIYRADGLTDEERKAVVPQATSKTIGSKKLNAEEYDRYTVSRGQTARETLEALMESPFWAISDDPTRAKMVNEAWTYANQISQREITGRKLDGWVLEANTTGNVAQSIVSRTAESNRKDYITAYGKGLAEALDSDNTEDYDTCMAALEEAGATKAELRTHLRNYFKPLYQSAYMDGDYGAMDDIRDKLIDSGTGFKSKDFNSWIPGEEEDDIDTEWLNR